MIANGTCDVICVITARKVNVCVLGELKEKSANVQ